MKSGHLKGIDVVLRYETVVNLFFQGYGGDVWDVQPAPQEHPLRRAKNPLGGGNGMVPHMSGTSIDAQERYANGTKSILEKFFKGEAYTPADVIVING